MTADQWAAMALLAAIWAASVVWCWLEYRRGPVDPPWADFDRAVDEALAMVEES